MNTFIVITVISVITGVIGYVASLKRSNIKLKNQNKEITADLEKLSNSYKKIITDRNNLTTIYKNLVKAHEDVLSSLKNNGVIDTGVSKLNEVADFYNNSDFSHISDANDVINKYFKNPEEPNDK